MQKERNTDPHHSKQDIDKPFIIFHQKNAEEATASVINNSVRLV